VAHTPNFFIVGAPKSGTTSLYEYIKGHPQVFMSAVKEPNYFAPDLADPRDRMLHYPDDERAYLDLFAGAGDAARLGEASVRYLYSRQAPGLIGAASPGAAIVIMLRNPVDMAHSLYMHMVASGVETAPTFADALAAEDARHRGRDVPPRMNPRLSTYRDRASYGGQVPRWLDVFGRERVHIIIFEDFARDPAAELNRLLSFLGLDTSYRPADFRTHNPAHASSSRLFRRMLSSRPSQWLVWTALPRVIGDKRTRRLVQSFRHSRLHRRNIERPAIEPELRARLEGEFLPDVVAIGQLLGRDMSQLWFGRPLAPEAAAAAADAKELPAKEPAAAHAVRAE
jgi:hypothetical protein